MYLVCYQFLFIQISINYVCHRSYGHIPSLPKKSECKVTLIMYMRGALSPAKYLAYHLRVPLVQQGQKVHLAEIQ